MSEMYCLLGRTWAAEGNYAQAVPYFRQAVAELEEHLEAGDPHLAPAVHELGRMLWRAGEKGESQTTLDRACRLARRAFEDGELEVRDAATGEKVDPAQLDMASARVGCHEEWLLSQGQFEEAAAGLRAREEREDAGEAAPDPGGMPAAELLAEAELGLGDQQAAREAYLRAAARWEERLSAGHPWAERCREKARGLDQWRAA